MYYVHRNGHCEQCTGRFLWQTEHTQCKLGAFFGCKVQIEDNAVHVLKKKTFLQIQVKAGRIGLFLLFF